MYLSVTVAVTRLRLVTGSRVGRHYHGKPAEIRGLFLLSRLNVFKMVEGLLSTYTGSFRIRHFHKQDMKDRANAYSDCLSFPYIAFTTASCELSRTYGSIDNLDQQVLNFSFCLNCSPRTEQVIYISQATPSLPLIRSIWFLD